MNKGIITTGGIIILLGLTLLVYAGPTAERVYLEPEENAEWRVNSTEDKLIPLPSDETYELFIKRGGLISNISIIDESGTDIFNIERCEDVNRNELEDCEYEWVEYGAFETYDCPCRITLNTTDEVLFVKEGAGGEKSKVDEYTAAICGGFITIGIGVLIISISGGIALFSNNKTEYIQVEDEINI